MYVSLTEAMIIIAVISMTVIVWLGGYIMVKSYDITDLAISHILSIHNALESVAYRPNNSKIIHIGLPVNTRIVFNGKNMSIKVFKNSPIDIQVLYTMLEKHLRENDYRNIIEKIELDEEEGTIYVTYKIPFSNTIQLRYYDRVVKISFTHDGAFDISFMGAGS